MCRSARPKRVKVLSKRTVSRKAGESTRAKVQAKRLAAKKTPKRDGSEVRELEKRLAEALNQRAEALEERAEALKQQAATGEILRVIWASPTDVQPVLDAVAERAALLCKAPFARLLLAYGDRLRVAAEHSVDGTVQARTTGVPLSRTSITGRAILDRAIIHHADILPLLDTEFPDARENARRVGLRAVLAVPLMREGGAFGAILLWRREPGLFAPQHVALVETFARQAAIAIDHARLFNETKEALEHQTATSEILRVISSSPTDVQPVFDIIGERATKLCGAHVSVVSRVEGEVIHLAAVDGVSETAKDGIRQVYPLPLGSAGSATGRAIQSRSVVHIEDVLDDPAYETKSAAIAGGWRNGLAVPMIREGQVIGAIFVGRPNPGRFADSKIELLKTFADQAVIAIENVRLFTELTHKNRALTEAHAQVSEALERQTATSEVLHVISSSPTDVQPVFETIAASAGSLCSAESAVVYRFDDEVAHFAAGYHFSPEALEAYRRRFPRPLRETDHLRRVLDGSVLNISDIEKDPHTTSGSGDVHRARGSHSTVIVPMLREDRVIGAIGVSHRDIGAFSSERVELLKTFADQAVIAIENVRLFNETKDGLERQTATSDILRVISESLTDAQPVFDIISERARKLCDAELSIVTRVEGDQIHLASFEGVSDEAKETLRRVHPMPLTIETATGRAVRGRGVVQIADVMDDPSYDRKDAATVAGWRGALAVPMIREGQVIGAVFVAHRNPGLFADSKIELLKTFADQAVIAIENVRLFNETKEALEQQTATSDILRVISQSPRDVQPVFDAIVRSAARLFGRKAALRTVEADGLRRRAASYVAPDEYHGPDLLPIDGDSIVGRAVLERRSQQVVDTRAPEATPFARAASGRLAFRSIASAPLVREGQAIGVISVSSPEPGALSDKQVALLHTFADQAVIAIENVRLFTALEARTRELTRSVGELKALGEVGQAVSSTLDLETVLSTIVSRATALTGMDAGAIYEYDEARGEFYLHTADRLQEEVVTALRARPILKGEGALGRMATTGEPAQIRDIMTDASYQSRLREVVLRLGYRSLMAVPLMRENHLLGGLVVYRKTPGEFDASVIDLLKTFATQSALAIQNARLFREIEVKSRQLESASQHKSEFLANMSHELRTPLNAIIGFSEVLSERMFGEINEKQAEYIGDILESGQHLLSLINDILDLSKIEAGRMELEPTEFDLPSVIENTLILVRERAQRHGITLGRAVNERLGTIRGDERKVKQVLLNLLSNALKFTPEGGEIEVRAELRDGAAEISVRDTGVGIAPEDQDAVFEEFRQVGTASKKVEGTGLGLAISRKFVELHGGRIWVKSRLGSGSTFTFTLPVR